MIGELDPVILNELRRLRKVLPGEVTNIWTSQTWFAPSDGFVRACLSSGGGGGSSYCGGASALAFWRWRKILKGQSLVFALGAGGSYSSATATDGGRSTLTAPWGVMTADPGKAGNVTSAPGGLSGTGADYYSQGGNGNSSSSGGALNPYCFPAASTLVSKFTTPPQGWLAVIDLKAVGNGGTTSIVPGPGGGGYANTNTGGGGAGFGIFEYCMAVA